MTKRLRDERRERGLYLPIEAAEILGVNRSWIKQHRKQFPPTVQHGARMVYTEMDLDTMRRYIENPPPSPQTQRRDRLAAEGWYTIKSAARKFGVPCITWSVSIAKGRAPKPTHRIGTLRYYSREEASSIAAKIRTQKSPPGSLTLKQMADRLGVVVSTLTYHLRKWKDIGTRANARSRWYFEADYEEIARRMAERPLSARRERLDGMLTTAEVAKRLGLGHQELRNKLFYRRLNLVVKFQGRLYYSLEDVMVMRRTFGLPVQVPML